MNMLSFARSVPPMGIFTLGKAVVAIQLIKLEL
jgi:hypothetical protein